MTVTGPTPPEGGSPPHAGTGLEVGEGVAHPLGITPARGDGTSPTRPGGRGGRDHPRTRGRDQVDHARDFASRGSPPHAGTGPGRPRPRLCVQGITPALGDGTDAGAPWGLGSPDHPRTRGRDTASSGAGVVSAGSPPHAGTGRSTRAGTPGGSGITPARGDGTGSCRWPTTTAADHPRTRGRDVNPPRPCGRSTGSPPHAGTGLGQQGRRRLACGITPARGDGTSADPAGRRLPGDHPRTRGRDELDPRPGCLDPGSPPHAGTGRGRGERHLVDVRITPARGDGTQRARRQRAR